MQVIPAIDIRAGRCVRLTQGDYARETVYADDPVEVARRWFAAGAQRIHVVDLDGAAGDGPVNLGIVADIVRAVAIPIQFGGGLKAWEHAEAALDAGVDRVILGTAAISDRALVQRLTVVHGEKLVVGIDARDGTVAVRGWKESSGVPALRLAAEMVELGVRRLIYTDIARDGMLSEPNYEALERVMATARVPVIASGGVGRLEHLVRLSRTGAEGAIVGRALYTGDVNLAEAIASLRIENEARRAD